jgi:hypothetical protein
MSVTDGQPENNDFLDGLLGPSKKMDEREAAVNRQRSLEAAATYLITDVTTDLLGQQLSRYKKLRPEEMELSNRVRFLEKQVAWAGHLQTPVSLALQLKAEKENLVKVQQELKLLVAELQRMLDIPFEERTSIDADRLAQLINEVMAKREQESIYRQNIYYLEELQAKQGLTVAINLFNELELTRAKHKDVKDELKSLEKQIWDDWHLEPDALWSETEGLWSVVNMSDQEIWNYAKKVALRKYQDSKEELSPDKTVDNMLTKKQDDLHQAIGSQPDERQSSEGRSNTLSASA